MKKRIRDLYFDWMYSRIERPNKDYRSLCLYLDHKPFYWNVPNDDNREADAIREREIFAYNVLDKEEPSRIISAFLRDSVSIFEVMVAICLRMDFEQFDSDIGERPGDWFEELLTNIGIRWAVDEEFDYRLGAKSEVDEAIQILLDRSYDYNGNGSFFPMSRKPPKHMATIEMWYQMQWYLQEKYPI